MESTLQLSSPVPLRVRQDVPTAGANSMGAEVYMNDVTGRPSLTAKRTFEF
jgi:hypothetical protein